MSSWCVGGTTTPPDIVGEGAAGLVGGLTSGEVAEDGREGVVGGDLEAAASAHALTHRSRTSPKTQRRPTRPKPNQALHCRSEGLTPAHIP